jgi:CRISPR-associated protein Csx17
MALRLIPFPGINTDCLGHYLMGLGLLRAVSTAWSSARGGWHGGIFWLAGDFEEDEIITFLTNQWQPTPYTKWWADEQKADTKAKSSKQLWRKRATRKLPDLRVSDTTIVPGHRNQFNPIFGTGGNIGARDLEQAQEGFLAVILFARGEKPNTEHFSKTTRDEVNRLAKKPSLPALSQEWLLESTKGNPATTSPSIAGAASWFVYSNKTFNSGLDWYREGTLSPWSFLLAMEGALLLRGGSSKRLGSRARPYAVFPFVSQPIDPESRDEVMQERKGEFWAPLWEQPATLGELTALLQRGLARIGGRAASAPHEFAVAATAAGTDAGITQFMRFELRQTTSSNANEAVPRQCFNVHSDTQTSELLTEFLGKKWFDYLPPEPTSKSSKTQYHGLRGRLEHLILAVAEDPNRHETWQELWLGLAACQDHIDHNRKLREKCRALPRLSPQWLSNAFPGTPPPEARIAAAFASIGAGSDYPALCNVFGVEFKGRGISFSQPNRPTHTVWHDGAPQSAILDLVQRRLTDSEIDLKHLAGYTQLAPDDIGQYLAADDPTMGRIHRWIPPLTLLDRNRAVQKFDTHASQNTADANLLLWAFFKPFFFTEELPINGTNFFRETPTAKPTFSRQLFQLIRQGYMTQAIDYAAQGYNAQSLRPIRPAVSSALNYERLASALLLPISCYNLAPLINRWLEPLKKQKESHDDNRS